MHPENPSVERSLSRWQRLSASVARAFHTYANWLVGITWKRFFLLAFLLMMASALIQSLPPFSWTVTETIHEGDDAVSAPERPAPPSPPGRSGRSGAPKSDGVDISIDDTGIRIRSRAKEAAAGASAAASSASAAASAASDIDIRLPPGLGREARQEILQAIEEAKQAAVEAQADAVETAREAQVEAQRELRRDRRGKVRTREVHWGGFLTQLALLWIVGSIILKATYKGRVQAEVKAAQATETAESESLKRQVVEARMAAMQAQVEPHFLFNTLASIDHLIETDPPRASTMQKNLIALLRASMPTMRENHPSAHNLGREMAVIRPYLEILKVRMEDRLQTEVQVPEGLLSADFPSMMIQSLVENAIKHGLEPKPEGGLLTVRAEIVHGKLSVTVADTGLGFGKAATAGTGIGLANIRERLQLLYGKRASMTVAENTPSGTIVTLTVPYQAQPREGDIA
ncbi:MAG: histidine kinase [Burkholderiaceae bacterium]